MSGKVVYYIPSVTQRKTEYLVGAKNAILEIENRETLSPHEYDFKRRGRGLIVENKYFSLYSPLQQLFVPPAMLQYSERPMWLEPILSLIPVITVGLAAAMQNNTIASNHKFGRYGCDDSYCGVLPHIYAAYCDCTVYHPITASSVMNSKILADFRHYLNTEIVMP